MRWSSHDKYAFDILGLNMDNDCINASVYYCCQGRGVRRPAGAVHTGREQGGANTALYLLYTPVQCLVQVVVLSPLNNFMVSSLHHNREERPSSLQWGLMGSVQVMTS